jgi:flagellar basal-body rod protein FlgC
MSDTMFSTLAVSSAGMRAQSERVRVISQNIANSDTTAEQPGQDPYRRQLITFKSQLDKNLGAEIVRVKNVTEDQKTDFRTKYMPGHPAADENGYVQMPNVNSLVETMDMREATRSYEANMGMFTQSRDMMTRTIDLLR